MLTDQLRLLLRMQPADLNGFERYRVEDFLSELRDSISPYVAYAGCQQNTGYISQSAVPRILALLQRDSNAGKMLCESGLRRNLSLSLSSQFKAWSLYISQQ